MNYAIIAAGEGSRLVQEGIRQPKPLVELNGIPLIDRLTGIFLRNNAESISIIINEEMTEVKAHLERWEAAVPFNLVVCSTPSSMHSFHKLSPFLKSGKFCLTTVDTIFREEEFAGFIRAFESDSENDGMMAVTPFIDDEKPLYVAVNEETMQITGFLDRNETHEKYISGGIYGLSEKSIRTLNHCIELNISRMRNFQRQLIADGLHLKAYSFEKIVDVDHAQDIRTAEAFITGNKDAGQK